ncbi:MAG: DUF2064 domain-containing protein [Melioribacteraceae bacterium]|nr:DUF2064 domain-containing protein [Melioribacteraceae bacterium]MCF8264488.1 DUF2064 domain-containing protein [Melioribacteraceae bacterium]MCF8411925.1 DUF2064 domain-containing protein [Melioribacteraceae bacterium]MCF8430940.1 DUF2064 domain-containing protein [Melioribacteraceae bacterium]
MNKQAIIIFSNDPVKDAEKKFSTAKNASDIFDRDIKNIISAAYAGCDLILSTEKNSPLADYQNITKVIFQSGKGFGERFFDAISKTFQSGYNSVCIVGNDTPSLTISDIRKSFKKISAEKTVIGPSQNGGFYLLTISKESFLQIDQNSFQNIYFQSKKTLSHFKRLLKSSGLSIYTLSGKQDLNSHYDFSIFQEELRQLFVRGLHSCDEIFKKYHLFQFERFLVSNLTKSFSFSLLMPPPSI